MENNALILVVVIICIAALGVYRKNDKVSKLVKENTDSDVSRPTMNVETMSTNMSKVPKVEVARLCAKINSLLANGESITQVNDYDFRLANGLVHVLDVTTFNRFTTEAVTKRIECRETNSGIQVLSSEMMSPVDEDMGGIRPAMNEFVELLTNEESDVSEVVIPEEPRPPPGKWRISKRNTSDGVRITVESEGGSIGQEGERRLYQQALENYYNEIDQLRQQGEFKKTNKDIVFKTTDEFIADSSKYPFEYPTTYGYEKPEKSQIDYDVLTNIVPLKDEGFFNSIALEKSILNIQYGT